MKLFRLPGMLILWSTFDWNSFHIMFGLMNVQRERPNPVLNPISAIPFNHVAAFICFLASDSFTGVQLCQASWSCITKNVSSTNLLASSLNTSAFARVQKRFLCLEFKEKNWRILHNFESRSWPLKLWHKHRCWTKAGFGLWRGISACRNLCNVSMWREHSPVCP